MQNSATVKHSHFTSKHNFEFSKTSRQDIKSIDIVCRNSYLSTKVGRKVFSCRLSIRGEDEADHFCYHLAVHSQNLEPRLGLKIVFLQHEDFISLGVFISSALIKQHKLQIIRTHTILVLHTNWVFQRPLNIANE